MFERSRFVEVDRPERGWFAIASALFLCMFAAQASVLVLSPVLTDVAREFGISTAVAGQLRSLSGVAAGVVALFATRLAGWFGLGRLLRGGVL
ncbi:MAG: hypothetical protein ACXVWF_05920, partial [Actinomycetota bacterium]